MGYIPNRGYLPGAMAGEGGFVEDALLFSGNARLYPAVTGRGLARTKCAHNRGKYWSIVLDQPYRLIPIVCV